MKTYIYKVTYLTTNGFKHFRLSSDSIRNAITKAEDKCKRYVISSIELVGVSI